MNDAMYEHPATQANVSRLRERGATVLDPVERALTGGGAKAGALAGVRVLVTAGGTREPIDAVRFVGNRSSGRMGYAVAAEAARRGAQVTVVAANVALPDPPGVRVIAVETAAQ